MVWKRLYSTRRKCNDSSVLFEEGAATLADAHSIPFVETRQITASRLVLAKMLAYLAKIDSPLYKFLTGSKTLKGFGRTVYSYC